MIEGPLDVHRRQLVSLSAALAARDEEALRGAMESLVSRGPEVRVGVEEVILQSYLFLGYPTALNAFGLWREISGFDAMEGVSDHWEGWEERGKDVCRRVYGDQYENLRRNIEVLHPDMERWMVVEGYGKVLARPGLDLATRELCIAALLAVAGAPRQLYSHLRGALNAGAREDEIEVALELAISHMKDGKPEGARRVWDRVKARQRAEGPPGSRPSA